MSIAKKKGRTWENNLEALKQYKTKKGDPLVPAEYAEDPALASWCRRQRQNQSKLSEEQRNQLVELGFVFENPAKARLDAQWNAKFEQLKQYAEEHGDCKIPKKFGSLGSWAHDQRQVYRRGGLSKERQEKLKSLGFDVQTKELVQRNNTKDDEKWKEKYQKLVAFKEEHGHANCPQRYSQDKSLGIWVDTQRQQYARNLIKEERKKLLDEIGFTWKREAKKSPAVKKPTNMNNGSNTLTTTITRSSSSDVRRTSDFAKINGFVRQIRDLGHEALKEFEDLAEQFLEDKQKKRKKEGEDEESKVVESDSKKQKAAAADDDEQEETNHRPS